MIRPKDTISKIMLYDTGKKINWGAADYVKSIMAFILCYLIISGFAVIGVLINEGSNFGNYMAVNQDRLLYLAAALVILFTIIYCYYFFDNRNMLVKLSRIWLIFSVITVTLVLCFFIGKYVNIYARPIPLAALLILMIMARKDAVIINIFTIMIVFLTDAFMDNGDYYSAYSTILIGFSMGMIAIYVASFIKSRLKIVFLGFLLALPVVLSVLFLGGFNLGNLKNSVIYGLTAGLGSVVLFMALLPIYEWIFNVVTNYRLSEITDHSAPLLKRMIADAPGTFNHCIVVATLAEACALAIGVNPQLARAAAYYHDAGKLMQPEYFKENQRDYNPHDELNPELSTEIIRSHARSGKELIRKYHLPEILGDVALEHHGTMPNKYFYHKAQKMTDGELSLEPFCYRGPKPQTKLAAIIMVADASEAVMRVVTDRSRENIDREVKKIIEERLWLDQFNECPITMSELYAMRKTIVDNIAVVYHERITYPKFDFADKEKEDAEAGKQ